MFPKNYSFQDTKNEYRYDMCTLYLFMLTVNQYLSLES